MRASPVSVSCSRFANTRRPYRILSSPGLGAGYNNIMHTRRRPTVPHTHTHTQKGGVRKNSCRCIRRRRRRRPCCRSFSKCLFNQHRHTHTTFRIYHTHASDVCVCVCVGNLTPSPLPGCRISDVRTVQALVRTEILNKRALKQRVPVFRIFRRCLSVTGDSGKKKLSFSVGILSPPPPTSVHKKIFEK